MINLKDYEDHFLKKMDKRAMKYVTLGAGEMVTTDENSTIFALYRLRPRFMKSVHNISADVSIFGTVLKSPIAIAPTGFHKWFHPDGETGTARGAAKSGNLMITSMYTQSTLAQISEASQGLKWLNVYPFSTPVLEGAIQTAEEHGFSALVLTVDLPVVPRWHWMLRGETAWPLKNLALLPDNHEATTNKGNIWEIMSWIKNRTRLPIVIKGVLTSEDAKLAIDYGADAIIVSNHGGRSVDYSITSLQALPEVISAVNGKVDVYFDSGIRTGKDVFIALALGAKLVLVGRPVVWGLSHSGADGVASVLNILQDELVNVMAFTGCGKLNDISENHIIKAANVETGLQVHSKVFSKI